MSTNRTDVFRTCHFSVQSNHVHLLVEAKDRQALSRGVQGLAIRLARSVDRAVRRTWLLGAGWQRAGPVRVEDLPVSP